MVKYKVGDVLGPYNILFLEEAGRQKRHRHGYFECPICHNKFEAEPSRVAKGLVASCEKCKTRKDTIYTPGTFVGRNKNILVLERKVDNNPKKIRLKCPVCKREDWICDIRSIHRIDHCSICDRKRRIQQFSQQKTEREGDRIGPFNIKFLRYSETGYRIHSKGIFECPFCGEEFEARIEHVKNGKIIHCNLCSDKVSLGEQFISDVLKELKCSFEKEKIFSECKNPKTNTCLRFDFYLPDYNCCIEYDGKQHFEPVSYFGGKEALEDLQNRDDIKNKFCKEHNIKLFRFNYKQNFNEIRTIMQSIVRSG